MNRIPELLFGFLFALIIFIFSSTKVLAVSITINSFPSIIDSLDSYQVNATISGATNATNYLRVDLYKDGSSNYFGETYNGSDWTSSSDGKSYYPIQIQNSSASATFYFQLGNPSNTQYLGPGAYKLKIRRYTSSGSASSNDDETPVDVQINYVFATDPPDPTNTPTPIATTVSATPPPRTATPTPLPTPTSTPTPSISPSPSPTDFLDLLNQDPSSDSGQVLGAETVNKKNSPISITNVIAGFIIGLGIISIGGSIYLGFKNKL